MNDLLELSPQQWAQLRTLLDEGLALPAARREAWLDGLDAEAAPYRPRLRSLLAHADDEHALARVGTLPGIETAQFAPQPPAETAGSQVGPYRLLRELGSGGMASVWLAERIDILQRRQVAIKLPHGAWRRAGLAERMAREREILATLEHPNIACLYDAGVAEDGQPWLALEFVAGEPIDAWCEHRRLGVSARLRLFLQVVRAAAYAHSQLVVHRDLKPSNILVSDEGHVKLLDFGIAKLLEQGSAEETTLTLAAGRALTPDFAAPEQILGRPVGTGADIYALGVLLYLLLTGQRPYRLARHSRAAMEEAIVQADIARPSSTAGGALCRSLRGDLDTIVLKALKQRPEDRYATAAALADDIERHLAHEPVLAQPDRLPYRLSKFVQRHALATGAALSVLVAVVAGAGAALWQARIAQTEQQRAEAVKDFVTGLFADADPFNTTSRAPTIEGLLQMAEERLRQPLAGGAATRVELLEMVGSSYVGLSMFERAEKVLAQAIDEGRRDLGADHPLTQRARITMLAVYRFGGRSAEMTQELQALLPALQAAGRGPSENLQRALTQKAHLDLDTGRYAEATAAARQALALAVAMRGEDDPVTGNAALMLASTGQFGGDAAATLALAEQARDRLLRIHGADRVHARVLDARFMVGRALGNVGRYAEAVDELRDVLQKVRALLGTDANMAAFVAADIARFQLELGRPADAERVAAYARGIVQRVVAGDSYTVAAARWTHGRTLLALGRSAPALEPLGQALGWMSRERGSNDPLTLDIAASHATAVALLGRVDEAWQLLAPRLTAYRAARPVPRHRGLHAAGLVRRLQGRNEEARALQHEALAALPDTPVHQPRRDTVHVELARLALERGDAREALASLRRLSRAPGAGGANGPEEAARLQTLARAHAALGQESEARLARQLAARMLDEAGGASAGERGPAKGALAADAR